MKVLVRSLTFGKYDVDLVFLVHADVRHWVLSFVARILQFDVKSFKEVYCQEFDIDLSKCLPKADSPATREWDERVSVPFLARWCQADRVVTVPSFWDELEGLLPLITVQMKGIRGNNEPVSLSECDSTELSVFKSPHVRRPATGH